MQDGGDGLPYRFRRGNVSAGAEFPRRDDEFEHEGFLRFSVGKIFFRTYVGILHGFAEFGDGHE